MLWQKIVNVNIGKNYFDRNYIWVLVDHPNKVKNNINNILSTMNILFLTRNVLININF